MCHIMCHIVKKDRSGILDLAWASDLPPRQPPITRVLHAQNLIRRASVQIGQSVDPAQEVLKLAAKDAAVALRLKPLPALFESPPNRLGQSLAGLAGDLPRQAFGRVVVDAERHNIVYILKNIHILLAEADLHAAE